MAPPMFCTLKGTRPAALCRGITERARRTDSPTVARFEQEPGRLASATGLTERIGGPDAMIDQTDRLYDHGDATHCGTTFGITPETSSHSESVPRNLNALFLPERQGDASDVSATTARADRAAT